MHQPSKIKEIKKNMKHELFLLNTFYRETVYLKLNAGSPGHVGGPHEDVLPLPALEQQTLLAVLHLRDLVDREQRLLLLHLRVRLRVRHHGLEVLEQVAAARSDAARAEDQNTALVGPLGPLGGGFLLGAPGSRNLLLHHLSNLGKSGLCFSFRYL